jgi:hypothetical protein
VGLVKFLLYNSNGNAGSYVLNVGEQDENWDIQLASNYSIWDATWRLLNTAQFVLKNTTYSCTSYDTSCDPIFPSHPNYAQPFLPILPKLIQAKVFTWLQIKAIYPQLVPAIDIQTDYEKLYPTVSNTQLKYFVALSANINNQTVKFHSPSDLPHSLIRIIGGVTNVDGEPLLDSIAFTVAPAQAACDYKTFQLVDEIFTQTVQQLEAPKQVGVPGTLSPSLR